MIRPLSGSKATWAMPPNQGRQDWITTQQKPPRPLVLRRSHCARS